MIVGRNGKKLDLAKIDIIEKWPNTNNLTELRGFIGPVQRFRRFLKDFSGLARPMTVLTKKEKGIRAWNKSFDEAFIRMKEVLSSAPVQSLQDGPNHLYYIWIHHIS